jgi:hypothetical protein
VASPRLLLSTALLAASTIVAPATANASALGALTSSLSDLLTVSDAACGSEATSHPFANWSDDADYVAAPGGSFEGPSSWTLSGRASLTADNEPWHVDGDDSDDAALELPAGSSTSSPSFCGGIDHPTVRLFARSASHSSLPSTALVTIRYTGAGDHLLAALPLGIITAGESWEPTSTTATLSGLKLLTGARLGVTITALTGTVLLDDVYVDPYRRS